jgi:hypothetical protein
MPNDWAHERAMEALVMGTGIVRVEDVAEALRSVRAEALKEAADYLRTRVIGSYWDSTGERLMIPINTADEIEALAARDRKGDK